VPLVPVPNNTVLQDYKQTDTAAAPKRLANSAHARNLFVCCLLARLPHATPRGGRSLRDPGGDQKSLSRVCNNGLSAQEATDLTGLKPYRVTRLKEALAKLDLDRQCLLGPQYRRAHLREGDARTLLNKGEVEWFTPAVYIGMARRVLGEIDLDPASGEIAQKTVQAKRWYSRDNSSLPHQWHGRIWMNPPYAALRL